MNIIKKLIINIILILICILGINTKVLAKDWSTEKSPNNPPHYVKWIKNHLDNNNIDDIVVLSGDEYGQGDSELYCIQSGQFGINGVSDKHRLKAIITIVGDKSTDHKDKTITSKLNVRLAHLIHSSNDTCAKWDSAKQHALWNFLYNWVEEVGQKHHGISLNNLVSNVGCGCPRKSPRNSPPCKRAGCHQLCKQFFLPININTKHYSLCNYKK